MAIYLRTIHLPKTNQTRFIRKHCKQSDSNVIQIKYPENFKINDFTIINKILQINCQIKQKLAVTLHDPHHGARTVKTSQNPNSPQTPLKIHSISSSYQKTISENSKFPKSSRNALPLVRLLQISPINALVIPYYPHINNLTDISTFATFNTQLKDDTNNLENTKRRKIVTQYCLNVTDRHFVSILTGVLQIWVAKPFHVFNLWWLEHSTHRVFKSNMADSCL